MPGGLLVTRAFVEPDTLTVKVCNCPAFVKVALQTLVTLIVTTPSEQSASPLHPSKMESEFGTGVSVTRVFSAKADLLLKQSVPQFIPEGLLVTVPVPSPDLLRVRLNVFTNP